MKRYKVGDPDFQCGCGCGLNNTTEEIIEILNALIERLRRPIRVLYGTRCQKYNEMVGGHYNSSHLRGSGLCIHCNNASDRHDILTILIKELGIHRIGVGFNFIHFDVDSELKPNQIWIYKLR